jgi:hypothetical protein
MKFSCSRKTEKMYASSYKKTDNGINILYTIELYWEVKEQIAKIVGIFSR